MNPRLLTKEGMPLVPINLITELVVKKRYILLKLRTILCIKTGININDAIIYEYKGEVLKFERFMRNMS